MFSNLLNWFNNKIDINNNEILGRPKTPDSSIGKLKEMDKTSLLKGINNLKKRRK